MVLFKRRPGADRRVGTARSHIGDQTGGYGYWEVRVHRDLGNHVWAKVKPKVRDHFVCRADRSPLRAAPDVVKELRLLGPKRQDPQNDPRFCDGNWCDLVVRVSCGHQKCTARARGRLTNVKNERLEPVGPLPRWMM